MSDTIQEEAKPPKGKRKPKTLPEAVAQLEINFLHQCKHMSRMLESYLEKIKAQREDDERLLKEVVGHVREVDETLCNVLLAIRQNEYLQAWYPAQCGHPEMKVVGSHPASARRRAREALKKQT